MERKCWAGREGAVLRTRAAGGVLEACGLCLSLCCLLLPADPEPPQGQRHVFSPRCPGPDTGVWLGGGGRRVVVIRLNESSSAGRPALEPRAGSERKCFRSGANLAEEGRLVFAGLPGILSGVLPGRAGGAAVR